MHSKLLLAGFLGLSLMTTSCEKKAPAPGNQPDAGAPPPAPESVTELKVPFSHSGHYTFFSFRDGVIAPEDSASNRWDFGMRRGTIIINSHSGGPGNAGVIFRDGIFDETLSAPETGYAYDTSSTARAIREGSWYDFHTSTFTFVPKAGKVFLFRTGDGAHYARMEFTGADYEPFTGSLPETLIYTIRFSYRADGSRTF